ncbi:uncharacterized protein LOC131686069 isoform X2 [Topomyia yanbarensis]|uniref:uncharacterized protein LOC131686069 isoform X2 n=1 Tax=Topomyia yanbarensis TaxID=2498891 RepID=UPI00273BE5A0|nr:uncharacterized protein LOC131686069 isoform X2 [Topomyia yanbarensis]
MLWIIQIESGPDAPPPITISTSPQRRSSFTYAEEAVDQSDGLSDSDFQQLQFQRLINERCVSLLNEFIHTMAVSVSRQLAETDNLLMKSQMILQNTTTAVRKINESTEQVASKLQDTLSSNFIPNIKIQR